MKLYAKRSKNATQGALTANLKYEKKKRKKDCYANLRNSYVTIPFTKTWQKNETKSNRVQPTFYPQSLKILSPPYF